MLQWSQNSLLGSSEGTLPSQISGGAFRHTDKEFWLHSDDATIHEHIKDLFDDREDFGFAKLPPQEQDEPTNIRCCAPQQQLLPEACVAPLSNLHLWIYNTPKKAQRPWHGHGMFHPFAPFIDSFKVYILMTKSWKERRKVLLTPVLFGRLFLKIIGSELTVRLCLSEADFISHDLSSSLDSQNEAY